MWTYSFSPTAQTIQILFVASLRPKGHQEQEEDHLAVWQLQKDHEESVGDHQMAVLQQTGQKLRDHCHPPVARKD